MGSGRVEQDQGVLHRSVAFLSSNVPDMKLVLPTIRIEDNRDGGGTSLMSLRTRRRNLR